MATLTQVGALHAPARPAAGVRERLGTAPFVLSIALAVDAAVASVASLLLPELIHGPAVSVGSLRGTALVILVVGLPVLLVSMALAARGSYRAAVVWFGAVAYVTYQGVLFLFGTPFNQLFFVYLGLLGFGVWALIVLLVWFPVAELAERVSPRMPVRVLGGYLLLLAAAFELLWLRAIVPAVLSSEPPAFLAGTGMMTGPGQILDLAFALPATSLAAVLLWRRRPWGYVLGGGLLVMLAIEAVSIGVDQWFGHEADPASAVVSAELVPAFAVMALIGGAAVAGWWRAVEE